MKHLKKQKYLLFTLALADKKLQVAILKNCSNELILTLNEIIYNLLKGGIQLDKKKLKKLKKFKKELRVINNNLKKKNLNSFRKVYIRKTNLLTILLKTFLKTEVIKYLQ